MGKLDTLYQREFFCQEKNSAILRGLQTHKTHVVMYRGLRLEMKKISTSSEAIL